VPSTGGSVGIGTATPSEKLHVVDARTTASSAGIYVQKTGAVVGTSYGSYSATTGASTTNIGGYFTASGGTNNYAIIVPSTGGRVGIGTTTPTAVLHLKAGTATLSTAPLKFTSGALLTAPEVGAVEFLTNAYYATITTGTARKTFAFLESPLFTGTPTLPTGTIAVTQAANTNNTTVATTAYVDRTQIFPASLSLTSAEILTLNTTPITIVAAPGAGKYIEVISATGEYTFITAAYTANTVLQLINTGATNPIAINQAILTGTVNLIYQFNVAASTTQVTATQILTNTALQVKVQTGNPSLGSGTVKIKVLYRIVTI
jgi:hypothetical protein